MNNPFQGADRGGHRSRHWYDRAARLRRNLSDADTDPHLISPPIGDLTQKGRFVIAEKLLADPRPGVHCETMLATGPFGVKRINLNIPGPTALETGAINLVPAFLLACDARAAVLLGFTTMSLAEADGTLVHPPVRKRAATMCHWEGTRERFSFAGVTSPEGHPPAAVRWEPLRLGQEFRGPYIDAAREGMRTVAALRSPEHAEFRRQVAWYRAKTPPDEVIIAVAEALARYSWGKRSHNRSPDPRSCYSVKR